MKDQVWFNGEIALFVSSPNNSPAQLPLTVIKRMTWVDTQNVSLVLEGILPAAKALLWIGQGDTLEVLWFGCSDYAAKGIYDPASVAMLLVNCQTKYRRIKDLYQWTNNGQDPIKIEVRLACRLEVVGELNANTDNANR